MISSKSATSSNFLETKETISSTLRFWIISKCFGSVSGSSGFSKSVPIFEDFIKLIKEHGRKIRIVYSPESGWPKAKHYENNRPLLLIWRTIKESALLKGRLMLNAIMLNVCRTDICRLLSPTAFDDSPSGQFASSTASRLPAATPGFLSKSPTKRLPVRWLLRSFVERVSRQPCPNHHFRKCYLSCRNKFQHVNYTLMHRRSSLASCLQVFQNY